MRLLPGPGSRWTPCPSLPRVTPEDKAGRSNFNLDFAQKVGTTCFLGPRIGLRGRSGNGNRVTTNLAHALQKADRLGPEGVVGLQGFNPGCLVQ